MASYKYVGIKKGDHWHLVRFIWLAGRWLPYNRYIFDTFDRMIGAINDD